MIDIVKFVLAVLLCSIASSSFAVIPENGMYWVSTRPGTGYYIEHQNGQVALAIYTYDESGRPTFLTSSGVLRGDAQVDSPVYTEGLYPVHGMVGELYRSEGGGCPTCPYRPVTSSVPVGRVVLTFAYANYVDIELMSLDGVERQQVFARRFNFGFVDWLGPLDSSSDFDMRGEWVFVDQSDPARAPWRFAFTEAIADRPPSATAPYEIRYVDLTRGAELVCIQPDRTGLTSEQIAALPQNGCELRVGGAAVFSIKENDKGLDRVEGFLGPLPTRGSRTSRGPSRVVGLRVQSGG